MYRTLALALLLTSACGTSKKDDGAKASSDKGGPPRVSNHTLATTPLADVTSTAGGIKFTIRLPQTELKEPEVKGAYATWEAKKGWFDTPSFTVLFNELGITPDSTGASMPMGDDAAERAIVRAEKLPDGGYINIDQRKDHAYFRLEVCRPLTKGALCCSVQQRVSSKPPGQSIESFDELAKLAETVCLSMKPQ